MSHVCGRSSSDKDRILNVLKKQFKTRDKNCCSVNKATAYFKCANYYSKTDGQHRAKRLKSRKERGQLRGCGKEAPRSQSHHHHCCRQRSKDITYINDRCCHSSCHCSSRHDASLSSVVPATQEPSIITDSRLIGHHGLFNHEVKSIDIERLLSKQRKMEKNGQQAHENNSPSHPSSTSHVPTPISSNDLLGAEVVTLEEEEAVAKAHDDLQMKEDKLSQGSVVTPGQKTSPVMPENELQLTPTDGREDMTLNKRHMISTLEKMPQTQGSPIHHCQPHGVSKSPLELPSSGTAERSVSQCPSIAPSSVSESVHAVAASLCGCLQLPVLRKRNLVAESREVLLKALQEGHGARLQENLFRLRRYLSGGSDHAKEVQDKELTMIDEDKLQYTDAFTTEFQTSKPFFNTPNNISFKRKGSAPLDLWSSPLLLPNPEQTDEWFRRPEETLFGDSLRPPPSAQFCMDFEPSGISDHLFAPSPKPCWEEEHSQFPHWGDSLSRQMSKETYVFDSFENRLMNQTRALNGSHYTVSNSQNFPPLQAQLQERHSTESLHFPREKDPFGAERYSFASSFSSQVQRPDQVSFHSFQPFSQISHSSACPPLRPHHTDMIHYPPSHMLEREPAPSRSSLLSPEHWTFPPMRLY